MFFCFVTKHACDRWTVRIPTPNTALVKTEMTTNISLNKTINDDKNEFP